MPVKRLKNLILGMEEKTSTYRAMYDGNITLHEAHGRYPDRDPIYYCGDIGFEITATHKLAQDKPTVTVMIPKERLSITNCTPEAADLCLRELAPYIDRLNAALYNCSRPDTENGKYYLHRPSGEILIRNTSYFALCQAKYYENGSGLNAWLFETPPPPKMCLCIRMQIQLPQKRLKKAMRMLCHDLPQTVEEFITEFDSEKLSDTAELSRKQSEIRAWLKTSEYCAFVANGSILPRSKGTDLPMRDAIPFQSTPNDEIEICGVRGMGIKRGVTVITGGGYSGKSTLLDAISAGIYNHVIDDGRELCITDETAVTISAEDGRSIKSVNISPFIKWLPNGDTRDFSTDHASGSTSQAANIMEAIDSGTKLLLIDEDRSATNFMIRDKMMKALIEKEPITPFTDRVNELYTSLGISTILVIGGSGEYLSVADRIYMMDDYLIHDVTEKSKTICGTEVNTDTPSSALWRQKRTLYSDNFSSYPNGVGSEKLVVSDMGFILIGDEAIDVRGLNDIKSKRQIDTLGFMLRLLMIKNRDQRLDIDARIDELYREIEENGLDAVYSPFFTTTERFLDLPRKYELKAVINRMRQVKISSELM